eukprot:CAMPEP_0198544636 /NCGR_PEP_ID=MMETSP1462-20131121/61469_1 /TAXON_ID=1333877 /ORGANISM="Brandtodinium nutriculum, Strain RCC3387" /LENGTH=85 /DNA_ID=CAMNT_0044274975 /DNA_START=69 /DNA_END=322 /DNA_ORIENTATION=-
MKTCTHRQQRKTTTCTHELAVLAHALQRAARWKLNQGSCACARQYVWPTIARILRCSHASGPDRKQERSDAAVANVEFRIQLVRR